MYEVLKLGRLHNLTIYKGSTVLGIYQICLQYLEKYCLDTLGYMSPRKTPIIQI
jgi:hypothetical protein